MDSDEPDTFIFEGNSLNTLGKSEPDYGAILWCVCVWCAHFYVNQIMVLFCGVCVVHIFMCIFFSQRKILVDFPERSQIYFYPHEQLW